MKPLGPQMRRVLEGYAEGMHPQEIAEALFISINTVRYHVARIKVRFGARNITQAVAIAVRDGVLWADDARSADDAGVN